MLKQFIGVVFLITILAINGFGESDSNVPHASDKSDKSSLANSDCDYLVGWYKMGRYIIPVLKIEGGYYSVCRGFEIPLKPCADGLEWGVMSSSMVGTTIGFEKAANAYYIIIKDSMRASVEDETSESIRKNGFELGKKTPAAKVDKPAGLLDANAPPPKTIDDFLGIYQSVWFPYVRFTIQKDGDKYFYQEQNFHGSVGGGWAGRGKPRELTILPDKLGFADLDIIYDQALERFEIIMKGDGKELPAILRMPLARNPSSSLDSNNVPQALIGIPSWH